MKILILGSEGFVGHNLISGLSNTNEIFSADLVEKSSHPNYAQLDITDYESVEKIVKNVDIVINLAAHSLVSSIEGPRKNAEINIIGLLNILESCKNNGIKKIIFTSASSLVGEPQNFKVSEEHLAKPKTAYGITKLTSEHYLRLYHELNGLEYVIFRFFNIYGPFQKNGLIPTLYKKIVNNEPLTVFGKGDQVRDYVFIEDVVQFFSKACSTNNMNSIFNMGTGQGTTILEIINIMSDILNVKPQIDFQPPRPGEIGNFVSDTTLLQSKFGSVPNTPIREGLKKTIEWLSNH